MQIFQKASQQCSEHNSGLCLYHGKQQPMLLLPTFFSQSAPSDLDPQEDLYPSHPMQVSPSSPLYHEGRQAAPLCILLCGLQSEPSLQKWHVTRVSQAGWLRCGLPYQSACSHWERFWWVTWTSSPQKTHTQYCTPQGTPPQLPGKSPAGPWSSPRNFIPALKMTQPTFLSRLNGTYPELNCVHLKSFCWIPNFHISKLSIFPFAEFPTSKLRLYLEIRLFKEG